MCVLGTCDISVAIGLHFNSAVVKYADVCALLREIIRTFDRLSKHGGNE